MLAEDGGHCHGQAGSGDERGPTRSSWNTEAVERCHECYGLPMLVMGSRTGRLPVLLVHFLGAITHLPKS